MVAIPASQQAQAVGRTGLRLQGRMEEADKKKKKTKENNRSKSQKKGGGEGGREREAAMDEVSGRFQSSVTVPLPRHCCRCSLLPRSSGSSPLLL